MSRLIDADALIEALQNEPKYSIELPANIGDSIRKLLTVHQKMVVDVVKKQPTAYDVEKLIGRLEALRNDKYMNGVSRFTPKEKKVFDIAETIVNQLAEEYNGGWITDRNPTREECGEYGHAEFQVTIPQPKGNKTITMDFVYETVRGKEVARWKWCGRLTIWKVLAWKPLDAPYQPENS